MSREAILASVRRSLGRGPLSGAAWQELEDGLRAPVAGVVPGGADGESTPHGELVARFAERAREHGASLADCRDGAGIPGAIRAFLDSCQLPPVLPVVDAPFMRALPWESGPGLTVQWRPVTPGDLVAASCPFRAIAETGTLVFRSGRESPVIPNFAPAFHIAVLRTLRIVASPEQVFAALRVHPDAGAMDFMPRALNLVSGPSRTADIEQTLVTGAHGPVRLHIILLHDPEE